VQTAAILTGIIFGLRELGELRKSRELDATLKLVDVIENESTGMGTRRGGTAGAFASRGC
jgi:hypothetical protein